MAKRVWIFGIGRFGDSVISDILEESNLDLVLVDKEARRTNKFKEYNVPLYVCDTEISEDVNQLGLEKNDFCLVLMSSNIGASILTCQNLIDQNILIDNIFVRVINKQHKRILASLGIKRFIDPDKMIAHKITLEIAKEIEINYFDHKNYVCKLVNNKVDQKKIEDLKELKKAKINILLLFRLDAEGNKIDIYPHGQLEIKKKDEILLLVPKNKIDKVNEIFKK